MTIGDEKVVARFSLDGYGGWMEQDDRDGDYVLHSAYAELAAEKDERIEELKVLANHLIAEKANAESQLAELRGRLDGLADSIESWHWDIGDVKKAKQFATDLRTLASADGATTGETK